MNLTGLDVARAYAGTLERAGARDNPLILHWLEICKLEDPHDEIPWCSAFINGVVEVFGGRVPRSGSPAARSWLRVGKRVPLAEALPGWDVVILQRGQGPQPGVEVLAAPGHVGFFTGRINDRVVLLGGNQSDSVNVQSFPAERVLAVQRIFEE